MLCDSTHVLTQSLLIIMLVRAGASCLLHGTPEFNRCFSFALDFCDVVWRSGISIAGQFNVPVGPRSILINHGGYHSLFLCP